MARREWRRSALAAQTVLGSDISRLCFEGPRELLDLTMNTQVATNPTQVHAVDIQLNSFLAKFRIIAVWLFLRSIFAAAQIAPIALTA